MYSFYIYKVLSRQRPDDYMYNAPIPIFQNKEQKV